MAVAFRSYAHSINPGSTSTSITVAKPSGTVQNDLLVAFLTTNGSGVTTAPTAPSGWTYVKTASWGPRKTWLYYKVAGSSEGTNYTWTAEVASGFAASIACYSGVDTAAPINVSAGASASSTTVTAPSVGTTVANTKVLAHAFHASVTTLSTPSGTLARFTQNGGSGYTIKLVEFDQAAAGATGSKLFTAGASGDNIGFQVAVAPNPNVAPNAATLVTPIGNKAINRAVTQRFDWDFSDPDAGDSQSKYDLRYRVVGTSTWTTVTGTTTSTFRDFAAGTFTVADYEWQVRTYDAAGLVGPYSASGFFSAVEAPVGPTITDPINGQTIATESYTGTFSYPTLQAWEWRVLGDTGGVADTAKVVNPIAAGDPASRTFTMTALPNGATVHPQVRVQVDGLWSDWTDSTNPVSFTPPATPTVDLVTDSGAGSIAVVITNPAPGTGQPTVTSHDVWRRVSTVGGGGIRVATGVTAGGSWTDYAPASGVDYEYRAVAIGDNLTTSTSAWVGGSSAALSGDGFSGF